MQPKLVALVGALAVASGVAMWWWCAQLAIIHAPECGRLESSAFCTTIHDVAWMAIALAAVGLSALPLAVALAVLQRRTSRRP